MVFCAVIHGTEHRLRKRLPNPWLRVFAGGCAVTALTLLCGTGDYNGAGMGVIAAAVEDYMNARIKKHELTRKDKEEDRMKHVRVNNANVEPVFFAFPDNPALDAIIRKVTAGPAEYDFTAPDGFGHHFWVISDRELVGRITEEFAKIPSMYIADGHHRTAAAALVGHEKACMNAGHTGREEYNYFLAVAFPSSHLRIIDYNRVVRDLNGLSADGFLCSRRITSSGISLTNSEASPEKVIRSSSLALVMAT